MLQEPEEKTLAKQVIQPTEKVRLRHGPALPISAYLKMLEVKREACQRAADHCDPDVASYYAAKVDVIEYLIMVLQPLRVV